MLDRLEVKHDIDELLACVSRSDGELLRLAFFHDLDREALAKALNLSPSAARMRLHRALNRLRSALTEQREAGNG
jgi:DNA-directed RNA polymerase specialized sigma24 family protein